MSTMDTLRDVACYPYGTLSPEYISRNKQLEQRAHLFLGIDKLGDSKIVTPMQTLEKWFRIFFSNPTNFFCCTSPSRPLFRLCDFLTRSPFFCLYIASVTLGGIHCKSHLHKRPTESLFRDFENGGLDPHAKRTKSIIGICSNPPRWILHKNRRIITTFLQMMLENEVKKEYVHPSEPEKVHITSQYTETREGTKKRGRKHEDLPCTKKKKQMDDTDTDKTVGPFMVKKKKKSAWNLIAYLTLDCHNHSSELIHRLVKESLHSKGIANRIQTLCDIGKRMGVPLWISRQVVDNMSVSERDCFYI